MVAEMMKDYNFGGGEDAPKTADGRRKTRKEVRSDVIARP